MTKNINPIKDLNDYESLFTQGAESSENRKNIEDALKIAIDTRKFEIELYWKRATYFWAFIAATFAAFFLLLNSSNIDQHIEFTIAISAIGYFFSLGWYFVNRGSKLWQKNWEEHVVFLENCIMRPLFSTVKVPNYNFLQLTKEYPFSVSKVNQNLSLMMVLFWFGSYCYSVVYTFYYSGLISFDFVFVKMVVIVSLFLLSYISIRTKITINSLRLLPAIGILFVVIWNTFTPIISFYTNDDPWKWEWGVWMIISILIYFTDLFFNYSRCYLSDDPQFKKVLVENSNISFFKKQ